MTCPYCHAPLQKGYLKSSQAIFWGPERAPGSISGDIPVARPTWKGLLEGLYAESGYCEACGKIIISLDQP